MLNVFLRCSVIKFPLNNSSLVIRHIRDDLCTRKSTASSLLSLFQFNQSIKAKKHKIDIRSKIQKMDIQDAEFEENPDE